MADKLLIPLVLGSGREGRRSERVADYMVERLAAAAPEGITVGSTLEQVRTTYPTLALGHNWSSADIPGHPGAHYGFLGIRLCRRPYPHQYATNL